MKSQVYVILLNTSLASIHITKFKHLVYRLGQEPKTSLKRFFSGLGSFVIAASLIVYGYFNSHYFQIAGLVLLPIALYFAIYGYLGIFANRFSQVIAKADESAKNRDIF
ncbi:hypothetical protein ACHSBP_15610 [Pseudoalteromonas sp. XMcav1-K]|uniref:hypothetical protein n=1 Tax=Pseudoalteromonas sp. XMcav1-K TaxID=3374372 RepID=UPI003756C8E6